MDTLFVVYEGRYDNVDFASPLCVRQIVAPCSEQEAMHEAHEKELNNSECFYLVRELGNHEDLAVQTTSPCSFWIHGYSQEVKVWKNLIDPRLGEQSQNLAIVRSLLDAITILLSLQDQSDRQIVESLFAWCEEKGNLSYGKYRLIADSLFQSATQIFLAHTDGIIGPAAIWKEERCTR